MNTLGFMSVLIHFASFVYVSFPSAVMVAPVCLESVPETSESFNSFC